MDYKIEFERLMGYVKQGLSGVDIDKREVLGFLGLSILNDVFWDYENRLETTVNTCSYSQDGKHDFVDDVVSVCSYCRSLNE